MVFPCFYQSFNLPMPSFLLPYDHLLLSDICSPLLSPYSFRGKFNLSDFYSLATPAPLLMISPVSSPELFLPFFLLACSPPPTHNNLERPSKVPI